MLLGRALLLLLALDDHVDGLNLVRSLKGTGADRLLVWRLIQSMSSVMMTAIIMVWFFCCLFSLRSCCSTMGAKVAPAKIIISTR